MFQSMCVCVCVCVCVCALMPHAHRVCGWILHVCVCVCAFDAAYPSCVRMDFAFGRDGLRQPCRLDDTASWSTSRHSCRHLSSHCLCAASMLRASQLHLVRGVEGRWVGAVVSSHPICAPAIQDWLIRVTPVSVSFEKAIVVS